MKTNQLADCWLAELTVDKKGIINKCDKDEGEVYE